MEIPMRDVKLLWGRSAHRCSICRIELALGKNGDQHAIILGEQAHIVGEKPSAPRGNSPLSQKERNSYPNLILLCPTHHKKVDENINDFPVEKLHMIKTNHELWVENTLCSAEKADESKRTFSDLLLFIESISPLLKWLNLSIPASKADDFFTFLQIFWANHNISTENIHSLAISGLESFIRPLKSEETFCQDNNQYLINKLSQADHEFTEYCHNRSLTWERIHLDNNSQFLVEEFAVNFENLLREKANLDDAEYRFFEHALHLARYYRSCFEAGHHLDVPEIVLSQFFSIIDAYLGTLGFRLPAAPFDSEEIESIRTMVL
ncbi:MAG TPA: hypothetical protein PKW33_11815 [Anaerolineaceae bacterium]|nr:hypothetical protein [Anaerolineaceae bacterium]HPN52266.1 hypothetical protein [Anaerolineaceae bacterium]